MRKVLPLVLLLACQPYPDQKPIVGAVEGSALQMFPDTANHVVCYGFVNATALACVHVDSIRVQHER